MITLGYFCTLSTRVEPVVREAATEAYTHTHACLLPFLSSFLLLPDRLTSPSSDRPCFLEMQLKKNLPHSPVQTATLSRLLCDTVCRSCPVKPSPPDASRQQGNGKISKRILCRYEVHLKPGHHRASKSLASTSFKLGEKVPSQQQKQQLKAIGTWTSLSGK